VPCAQAAGLYRPRDPRATPLYRLVECFYDEVKGQWDEPFEARFGFWRGFVDRLMISSLVVELRHGMKSRGCRAAAVLRNRVHVEGGHPNRCREA
jgi:hypothetical protein